MELDELKESWKKIGEQSSLFKAESIKNLVDHQSSSPLVRLRKSMIWEIVAILICYVILYVIYFSKSFNSNPIAIYGIGFLTAISLLFAFFFYNNIFKRTKKIDFTKSMTRQLEENIDALKTDVDFYQKLNLFLYLPAVFVGILLANDKIRSFQSLLDLQVNYWIYIAIFTILFFPVYYWSITWWVKKFYGKYIEELEELYQEISSE